MTTLILLIHFFLSAGLIGLILMQRSEGGALGMGGGPGGLMSGRGAASLLTRSTSILAAGFFITSILLTVVSNRGAPTSVLDRVSSPTQSQETAPGDSGVLADGEDAETPVEEPVIPEQE